MNNFDRSTLVGSSEFYRARAYAFALIRRAAV